MITYFHSTIFKAHIYKAVNIQNIILWYWSRIRSKVKQNQIEHQKLYDFAQILIAIIPHLIKHNLNFEILKLNLKDTSLLVGYLYE